MLVCNLFLDYVFVRLTEEKTLSMSTFACGKLRRQCIKLQSLGNWTDPAPFLSVESVLQNSSGSMSSWSKGKGSTESLRHLSSSVCNFASGTMLGNLTARGTRDGNFA